jgi:hypothetical protein
MQAVWSDVSTVVEGVEVFGVADEVGGLSFSDEARLRVRVSIRDLVITPALWVQ